MSSTIIVSNRCKSADFFFFLSSTGEKISANCIPLLPTLNGNLTHLSSLHHMVLAGRPSIWRWPFPFSQPEISSFIVRWICSQTPASRFQKIYVCISIVYAIFELIPIKVLFLQQKLLISPYYVCYSKKGHLFTFHMD